MIYNNQQNKELKDQIIAMKQNLQNNNILTEKCMGKILQNVYQNSIPYLIFLQSQEILQQLFAKVSQRQRDLSEQAKQQLQQQLIKIINICNNIVPKFLQCFCYPYIRQIQRMILRNKQQNSLQNNKYNTPRQQFLVTVDKFIHAKLQNTRDKKNIKLINQAIQAIQKFETQQKNPPLQIYEQISLNWFKRQIDILASAKQNLCCRLLFFSNQIIQLKKQSIYILKQYRKAQIQDKVSRKRYTQITKNQVINFDKLQLARAIRNLMNEKGGAIIIGAQLLKANTYQIKSMQIDSKRILAIVTYIKQALNQVLPKHDEFQQFETQAQIKIQQKYILNYYVTIQFLRTVKSSTYQYESNINNIIRILVKQGHPREYYYVLYNVVNDRKKALVQFANKIQNQQNKPQSIQDYHSRIYDKFIKFASMDKDKKLQRKKLHDQCRIDMDMDVHVLDTQKNDQY